MPPKRFRIYEYDEQFPMGRYHTNVHGQPMHTFDTPGQGISDELAIGLASSAIPLLIGASHATHQIQKNVKDIPVLGTAVRLAKDYTDFVSNPANLGIVTSGPYATYLIANEIAARSGLLPRGPSLNLTPFIRRKREKDEIGSG